MRVPLPSPLRMLHFPPSNLARCRMLSKPKWFGDRLRIKADSPITNLDSDVIAMLHEVDLHLLAIAVLAGIRQGFLGNAVDAVLQGRVQSVKIDSAAILDLQRTVTAFLMDKVGDGLNDA